MIFNEIFQLNSILARLAKVEEENSRLNDEVRKLKGQLEETNYNIKDEFVRVDKEVKGLKTTISRQNEQIVNLAARIGAQEANRVSLTRCQKTNHVVHMIPYTHL